MPFNMAWFKAQAEKKKAEEAAKLAAEETTKVKEPEPETIEGGYYQFMKEPKNNPHYYMAEELTTPWVDSTDTQRLNMYSNHCSQMVHLKSPEIPRVLTNFENQVGEYSIAYKKADMNMKVIAKVVKNPYNYDLIVQKENGVYDLIHYSCAKHITEDYGYKVNDCIPDIQPGDTIEKGENIYKSDNYDDDGNFMTGVNLKAIYIPFANMTYEDGVVISKSAAEKLVSYKVETTTISINNNDLLVNLYGKNGEYKSFPKVGDFVDSKVLVASRRKDKRTSLFELQEKNISDINQASDDITYTSGGTVVDIDVFNNVPLAELRKRHDIFNQEILEVIENNYRYYSELATELEKIIPCRELTESEIRNEKNDFGHVIKHPIDRDKNPNKYTDELSYYWKVAHEYVDEKILWRSDSKSFDNFKVQFTILKENHLTAGSKVTGRLILGCPKISLIAGTSLELQLLT